MKRSSRLVLVGVSAVVIGVLGWIALAPKADAGDSPAQKNQMSWKDMLQMVNQVVQAGADILAVINHAHVSRTPCSIA